MRKKIINYTYTTGNNGRLCNQIIRNLAVSIIAEKHFLYVNYYNKELINSLGIDLFVGKNKYNNSINLIEDNYFEILSKENLVNNINPNKGYFQTEKITDMIFKNLCENKKNIIEKNKYKNRYEKNNDLFIHIRLSDASKWNPGIEYYIKCIKKINYDNIFISSDSPSHRLIIDLKNLFPECTILY